MQETLHISPSVSNSRELREIIWPQQSAKRKKRRPIYKQDKGEDVESSDMVARSVKEVLGSSIMDLRNVHALRQRRHAEEKDDFESDSDSEASLEDSLRQLSQQDTTWFDGCGLHLTLDTSIFFSQILVTFLMLIFCIIKLISSDDCSVQGTYAPILTAILGYYFSKPLSNLKQKLKNKIK